MGFEAIAADSRSSAERIDRWDAPPRGKAGSFIEAGAQALMETNRNFRGPRYMLELQGQARR